MGVLYNSIWTLLSFFLYPSTGNLEMRLREIGDYLERMQRKWNNYDSQFLIKVRNTKAER